MPDTAKVIRLDPEVQRHVRSRLVRLPAAAHALHERAKVLLGGSLEAYFDSADDALFELADNATTNQEQNAFFDSMREVRVQRKSIEKRFFEGFDEAFARLVAADERDWLVPEGELSADALSLVQNNEDIEQLVAQEATFTRANREFAKHLAFFNQVIRKMVPVSVNEHSNPLGPEILCACFMAQVKRLDVDIKAKLVLFKLFDRVVIQELSPLYNQLQQMLEAQGFSLQSARLPPNSPSAPRMSSTSNPSPPAPVIKAVRESTNAADDSTKKEDSNEDPNKELITLLSFIQKLPSTALAGEDLSLVDLLARVQNQTGQDIQFSQVQKETIRLVELMFDFMMKDRSLAKPVKDLLVRLQIPVLKVALMDEHFLGDKSHSARRLLNEISVHAVGWQGGTRKSAMNDPFAKCLQRIVEQIVNEFERNVEVFNLALADFVSYVDKERRRSSVLEKRMVDAEDGKARSEQARKRVAVEVSARLADHELPALVKDFALGAWSNVLFVSGLKNGFETAQWAEYLNLLSELVWSVQPKRQAQERQALIIKGPKILQNLKTGLDSVSYNPFEVSEQLIGIEELHIACIRGDVSHSAKTPAPEPKAQVTEPAAVSLASINEVKDKPANVTELNQLPQDDPHMLMVASFAQGSWFDLSVEDGSEPLRCRLAAYIKPTGKYIFVNRSGMKAAEKTRVELAFALKKGELTPVDSGMLFERALENIVTGLRTSKPASPLDDLAKKSD